MSVDINFETIKSGPDGALLAEQVRAFLHDRFQKVPLPRFIRSVEVHSFDFGSVEPDLEVKDVCDPLPDFYDSDNEDDEDILSIGAQTEQAAAHVTTDHTAHPSIGGREPLGSAPGLSKHRQMEFSANQRPNAISNAQTSPHMHPFSGSPSVDNQSPFTHTATPGIPGGTSNLSYFHLPLSAGLSGANTPLAVVAGGPHFPAPHPAPLHSPLLPSDPWLRPSYNDPGGDLPPHEEKSHHEPNASDIQVIARLRYAGDLRISLTADILLDYPMPNFVGIPLQLNVTGISFDGVAILAHIKRKAHFCFLGPEDADALVGGDGGDAGEEGHPRKPVGSLFDEIKVESEIGQRGSSTKPVLKNVGKVERFVLEQVRRIFENELVYPSFWTFLV